MHPNRVTLWGVAGQVLNRAGLTLPQSHYDTVVVGGGLLGLACAFYLRALQPEASLLVVEQDGIPSEEGATFASPAVVDTDFEDAEFKNVDVQRRAEWALAQLGRLSEVTGVTRPHDVPFRQVGLLSLQKTASGSTRATETVLAAMRPEQARGVRALVEVPVFSQAHFDHRGGYGSAEAAALHYGHGALKRGADLVLNARAVPLSGSEFKLERLEYDRAMRRVVTAVDKVTAEKVIVAAGASTVRIVEDALGVVLPYKSAYRQYPRVEADERLPLQDGRVRLPVIRVVGFSLRPQGEGLLVVPPAPPPDPDGYVPTGAQLMGVRVGVRRELLERLLEHTDEVPAFGWESLNLGKTVHRVRGAWDVLTPTGQPEWRRAAETNLYALVGGEHGFGLGLATAYDLAATLSGLGGRPWKSTEDRVESTK